MKKRRVFDEVFKGIAVELSHTKGSVQEAARELAIDSSQITKWRQSHQKKAVSIFSRSDRTGGPEKYADL